MTMILHFAVLLIVALRNSWRWGLAAWLSGFLVTGLVLGVFSLAGTGGFAGALANSTVAVAVGLGLPGIRSRVEELGGTVRAGSVDDGGYELSVRLPLG